MNPFSCDLELLFVQMKLTFKSVWQNVYPFTYELSGCALSPTVVTCLTNVVINEKQNSTEELLLRFFC